VVEGLGDPHPGVAAGPGEGLKTLTVIRLGPPARLKDGVPHRPDRVGVPHGAGGNPERKTGGEVASGGASGPRVGVQPDHRFRDIPTLAVGTRQDLQTVNGEAMSLGRIRTQWLPGSRARHGRFKRWNSIRSRSSIRGKAPGSIDPERRVQAVHRRIIPGLVCLVLVVTSGVIWWNMTFPLIDIPASEVSRIEIFSGTTGRATTIVERESIERLIDNLNAVKVSKERVSLGYVGFGYRITLYRSNERVYKSFIVNANDTIRRDPFFYKATPGAIDYGLIEAVLD